MANVEECQKCINEEDTINLSPIDIKDNNVIVVQEGKFCYCFTTEEIVQIHLQSLENNVISRNPYTRNALPQNKITEAIRQFVEQNSDSPLVGKINNLHMRELEMLPNIEQQIVSRIETIGYRYGEYLGRNARERISNEIESLRNRNVNFLELNDIVEEKRGYFQQVLMNILEQLPEVQNIMNRQYLEFINNRIRVTSERIIDRELERILAQYRDDYYQNVTNRLLPIEYKVTKKYLKEFGPPENIDSMNELFRRQDNALNDRAIERIMHVENYPDEQKVRTLVDNVKRIFNTNRRVRLLNAVMEYLYSPKRQGIWSKDNIARDRSLYQNLYMIPDEALEQPRDHQELLYQQRQYL